MATERARTDSPPAPSGLSWQLKEAKAAPHSRGWCSWWSRYSLAEAPMAMRHLVAGQAGGKLVVIP